MPEKLLVLGTRNHKKAAELVDLLVPFGFQLKTVADFPHSVEVDESGHSFAENAALKASEQAKVLRAWVLGEDSGLCVTALNDAPGIYSARYAGLQATDEENNAKLLQELAAVPTEQRTAYYVCSAALAAPDGAIRARSEGRCYGRIRTDRAGTAGFGYDPLFEVIEYHQTFGELGEAVKSVISHRSRALRQIIPQIIACGHSSEWE